MKKSILIFGSVLAFVLSLSFSYRVNDEWPVPGKYKKMENPMASDKEALIIGKELYSKHCKSCHGKSGLGDGSKSKELDTPSGDFSSTEFQAQTDGDLYYKTTVGRDDMPGFEKKISNDEDRWAIVSYMREFSK